MSGSLRSFGCDHRLGKVVFLAAALRHDERFLGSALRLGAACIAGLPRLGRAAVSRLVVAKTFLAARPSPPAWGVPSEGNGAIDAD